MAIERISVGGQPWRDWGYTHLQRYLFARDHVQGRVLDAACGTGFGSYVLAQRVAEVVGLDVSPEAISEARQHHARPNLRFHHGVVESLPPIAGFDAAVSLETIEHVPDPRAFLREIHARLKPGGRLVLSAPNVAQHQGAPQPTENPFHLHEPTYDELLGWLDGLFRVDEAWEQARRLALHHDSLERLGQAGARVAQLGTVRIIAAIERRLRRLVGRSLPEPHHPASQSDAMVAETVLLPLLPQRRQVAHTFLLLASRLD